MGFIMDGLDAEAYDRSYSDWQLVRRIAAYFRPQARKMAAVAAALLATALLDAGLPIFVARSIDSMALDPSLRALVLGAVVLTLLAASSWLLNALRQTFSSQAIGDVVLAMREDAADAVLKRDMSFYDQFPSGKIVSRVTSDTQAFSQVVSLTMDLLSRVLLVVLLVAYLATVSAQLTLLLLGLAPFIVGVSLAFRSIARNTITNSRRMNATVSAHIQETVSGIGVAKTFRQEPAIYAEFVAVNRQSRRVNMRTRFVFSAVFPLLNIIAGFGTAALVYFGGQGVREGGLTTGSLFLFLQSLNMFWFALTSIASFWSQFQIGLAAGERVFALIDAEPRVVQTDAVQLPAIRGEVRFEGVDFRYDQEIGDSRLEMEEVEPGSASSHGNGAETAKTESPISNPQSPASNLQSPWVLQNFSLHVRPGETLALVGHTGSGKSSIAKLIARFYEFQGGSILIDGVDIRALDLPSYRARLGIVTQTPFLFDGTVRENIRYGRPEASDEQVLEVARHVGGGDWIGSLPQGLDTPVGERGAQLSLGQRQLVALARVLLQDPAIVILDEATASIDPLTETLIQEGLDIVLEHRTSIVIAHRLSTVRHADRIIVLRQGQIIEQGNHEALLERGGHYAELYNTYFRHQSLSYIEEVTPALV
jgi:ABC-type multidrug transport system fused ATPase/permease subunit